MGRKNLMLTYNPDTHLYLWDGRPVPSVTQAMGLMYGDVYRWTGEEQRQRGTDIHSRIEAWENGTLDKIESEYLGRLESWAKFKEYMGFTTPTLSEEPLYSTKIGVAGTPDHLFGTTLVDIKSSDKHSPLTGIQTAGYKKILEDNGYKVHQRIEFLPRDDGIFDFNNDVVFFNDFKSDFRLFQCCLSLYQFKVKHYGQKKEEE
jgi:hypothetical protein